MWVALVALCRSGLTFGQQQYPQRRFVDLADRRVRNVLEGRDDYPARRQLKSTHALSGCPLQLIDTESVCTAEYDSGANSYCVIDGDIGDKGALDAGNRLQRGCDFRWVDRCALDFDHISDITVRASGDLYVI
jgi:hypothetical protein